MHRLQEFGQEVKKRFSAPLGSVAGKGTLFTINFKSPRLVSYVIIKEDIAKGEHIREYNLYGKENGVWKFLSKGSCVGHKRIEVLNNTSMSGIQLEIIRSEGDPYIREIVCY
jgi:hypothetical protein